MVPDPQMDAIFLDKIRLHFLSNSNLDSGKLLKFCDYMKISLRDFSSIMFHLLSDLLAEGESINFGGEYDGRQLEMGVLVEMEHTTNKMIAEKIAKDHLAEIPDYYTRLHIMEQEAGM